NHGVMDIMHLPKFCCYFYQSQSAQHNYDGSKDPMVFIANYYLPGSPVNRKVFTNCEQVRLYRNGTLVNTLTPDKAANACAHPPVTFTNVAFAAGELKAEGLINGQIAATHTVKTPGTVSAITLTADPDTIEANGGDFSRVVAALVDANGTVVPTASNAITFTLSGSGTAIGQNPVNAIAGYHIILAKATLSPGTIRVTATAGSAASNQVSIVTRPMRQDVAVAPAVPGTLHRPSLGKTIRFCGTAIRVRSGNALTNGTAVSVYDLKGNRCFQGIVDNGRIDLRGKKEAGTRSYIVRTEGISR
ncbi:MAG: DUF4982 domain-containing protein, partial [Chitinispirillaceae bacterium]|nr:DUF4982 domain-containing protein [Chitinispirillaceae bacterium]